MSRRRKTRSKFMILLGLSLITVALISLLGIILYGKFLGFLVIYPYTFEMITAFGTNVYLARIFAVLATIGFWIAIFYFMLSFSARNRMIGFSLLILFVMAHALALYLVNKDRAVTIHGEVGYCAKDPISGIIQYYGQPIYDPAGQQAHKCTKEEIRQLMIQNQYSDGEILPGEIGEWFDSEGKPLLYYYRDKGGKLHFRYIGGYSKVGRKWKKVTPEVLQEIQGDLEEQASSGVQRDSGFVVRVRSVPKSQISLINFYRNFPFIYVFLFSLLNIIAWVLIFKDKLERYQHWLGLISGVVVVNIIAYVGIDYSDSYSGLVMAILILSVVGPFLVEFLKGVVVGIGESV